MLNIRGKWWSYINRLVARACGQTTAFQKSDTRLRVAVENLQDAFIMICGERGVVCEWNAAAEQLFGYRRDEVLGQEVQAMLVLPSAHGVAQQGTASFVQLWTGAAGRVLELTGVRKGGGVFPVALSVAAMQIGKQWHGVGIARDMTERQRTETLLCQSQNALKTHSDHLEQLVAIRTAALEASEERLRLILDSNAAAIYGTDPEGSITFANPAACEMLGYSAEQLVGRNAHEMIHHSHASGAPYRKEDCPVLRTLRQGDSVRSDREMFWHANGHAIPVTYASQAMKHEGRIVGAVVSFFDMTAQVKAEMALEEALFEARRLTRVKSDFLTHMSHEIRTPLSAILGLAEVGWREGQGQQVHDTFGHILEAGRHLLGVINGILDFSKLEAGKLLLEEDTLVLGQVFDLVIELTANTAYAKGLRLRIDEAPDLPVSSQGDALRVSQVLVNLLGNAIKFTDQGEIVLSASRAGDVLICRVEDQGIGLAPEQMNRLFFPFEQADASTTRRYGGTGLGLAICKHLVDRMKGEIRVESQLHKGSCFEVRLPLQKASAPAPPETGRVALVGLLDREAEHFAVALRGRGFEVACWPAGAIPSNNPSLVVAPFQPWVEKALFPALKLHQRLMLAMMPGSSELPDWLRERVSLLEWPLRVRHVVTKRHLKVLPPVKPSLPGGRLAGLSILAAEDVKINRMVLERLLSMEGARLVCVENGRLALERLQQDGAAAYDIVLTDIQMPEMDGYETTRHIRTLYPALPVIGLTAHTLPEERAKCLAMGMVEHVAKPIEIEVLVAAILHHAKHRGRPPAVVRADHFRV